METEPSHSPKAYLSFVFSLLCLLIGTASAKAATVDDVMSVSEEVVKERLAQLDQSLLEHRFDNAVRRLIDYHLRYPKQTARNVGRAVAYFPMFEKELIAAGLPTTLKYLPVIESALLPRALSRVGAEGLWQFMPYTAPEYGLRIDEYVDERLDAQLATKAAIRYLQSAHEYLDDWSLAIAAYNCGKGRANRAKRRSGGRNFWAARRHFPRETRHYIPAFIAAIYLTEFYAKHDIEPQMPSLDEQLIDRLVVHQPLSFYRIAQVTGLSIDLIQQLNPSFLQGFLPGYPDGHNLILPERVIPALEAYLDTYGHLADEPVLPWAFVLAPPPADINHSSDYHLRMTFPTTGDSLQSMAERLQIPVSRLAIWNQLSPLDSLTTEDAITYYQVAKYHPLPGRVPIESIDDLPLSDSCLQGVSLADGTQSLPQQCIRLTLTHKQRPSEVLLQYPTIDPKAFLRENHLVDDTVLPTGVILNLGVAGGS